MEVSSDRADPPSDLLEQQRILMQAISYFAVGVASEGSIGGKDVSNQLRFAGQRKAGRLDPEGNSGFSIGTLQTDLGQHKDVASALVAAFQGWATSNQPSLVMAEPVALETVNDIGRTGFEIEHESGRDIDFEVRRRLDLFLDSDDGRNFVHERDLIQVEVLWDSLGVKLAANQAYLSLEADEQVRVATMLLKLQNQSGSRHTPRILKKMDDGDLTSGAEISQYIEALKTKNTAYIQSGREHALKGAEVLIALRSSQQEGPLARSYASVGKDPLVNPTKLHQVVDSPDLPAYYTTVKTMFLQVSEAPSFIRAVDSGATHIYGRPQPQGKLAATAGLFSSGDNLVVWNRDGAGYSYIEGAWAAVARDDLKRVTLPDKTIDLRIVRDGLDATLLHLDRNAPALRPEIPAGRQEAQSPSTPRPLDPLDEQARDAVQRLDASLGRTPDAMSLRMADSLAGLARQHQITRIDHVLLSHANPYLAAGEHVFVVQGRLDDPSHVRAQMRTDDALCGVATRTPSAVDGSNARMHAQETLEPGQQVDPPRRMLG